MFCIGHLLQMMVPSPLEEIDFQCDQNIGRYTTCNYTIGMTLKKNFLSIVRVAYRPVFRAHDQDTVKNLLEAISIKPIPLHYSKIFSYNQLGFVKNVSVFSLNSNPKRSHQEMFDDWPIRGKKKLIFKWIMTEVCCRGYGIHFLCCRRYGTHFLCRRRYGTHFLLIAFASNY